MPWLALAMTLTAAPSFTLDLVGWNNAPKPTAEQKKICQAFLDAETSVSGNPKHNKVGQVSCTELEQDLLPTHRFFQCRVIYEANAVDGGPHHEGQVMAWDGKRGLLHQWTARRDGDAAMEERGPGLQFRSPSLWHQLDGKDEAGEKFSAALNAALARRSAVFKAGAELPSWALFALCLHFEVATLEWQPGLPSEAALKKEFGRAEPGYAAAARLAAEKAPGGTVRFHHGGTWAVYVHFDGKGFSFRERTIGFRADHYG